MGSFEQVEKCVEGYMNGTSLEESQINIVMALESDGSDRYDLEYFIKESNSERPSVERTFSYTEAQEAWNDFIDHGEKLRQTFPEADLLMPDPNVYESSRGGGNPFVRMI